MKGQFDDADEDATEVTVPTAIPSPQPSKSTLTVSQPSSLEKAVKVAMFQSNSSLHSHEYGDGTNEYSDEDDGTFDTLEAALMGEDSGAVGGGGGGGGGGKRSGNASGADFGTKVNLSVRIQNDITRSEKKGEKRPNYYGRDDRATSEQVLDPRTKLILFKLLGNGFLAEIDGEIEICVPVFMYALLCFVMLCLFVCSPLFFVLSYLMLFLI